MQGRGRNGEPRPRTCRPACPIPARPSRRLPLAAGGNTSRQQSGHHVRGSVGRRAVVLGGRRGRLKSPSPTVGDASSRVSRTRVVGRWVGGWVVRVAACPSSCKRCDRRAPRAWRRGREGAGVSQMKRMSREPYQKRCFACLLSVTKVFFKCFLKATGDRIKLSAPL